MNFQQIQYLCAICDHDLNISRASEALKIVQPALSRQMLLLEEEIGAQIFVRSHKRILALTSTGDSVLKVARRIAQDIQNIRKLGAEHRAPHEGELTIATSHTHARYALPAIVERYSRIFPKVRVTHYEGNPEELGNWLSTGVADISISTKPRLRYANLAFLPVMMSRRMVIVPVGHKLLKSRPLTLEKLAEFPIIAFHSAFPSGENVVRAFRRGGITPLLRVKAANSGVVKAYVRQGLGVGIISSMCVSPEEDRGLRMIDAAHLFPSHQILAGLRKGHFLQEYAYDFLKLVAPALPRADIERVCGKRAVLN